MLGLVQDGLRFVVLAAIAVSMTAAVMLPPASDPAWLDLTGRGLAALGAQLVAIALLRVLFRRVPAGAHRVGFGAGYVAWIASTALAEVALHPLVRSPFWLLHATRVLYLRALGARVSWRAFVHPETQIRDPSLLAVGAGSRLEAGVVVEAGFFAVGRVRVETVTVGRGCHVGAGVILLPGVTLGHDARVEPGALVGEEARVGVSALVGAGARLERRVDLGSYTTVGTGAVIGDGVTLGDRARVPAGAVVPADTKIAERETYQAA